MKNVSVRTSATVISITSQTTRTFSSANPPYTKTLIQFNRDKLKLVDDFVSDHCMEIPGKIQVKYAKRFVAE